MPCGASARSRRSPPEPSRSFVPNSEKDGIVVQVGGCEQEWGSASDHSDDLDDEEELDEAA
jgi:hypothetical protein